MSCLAYLLTLVIVESSSCILPSDASEVDSGLSCPRGELRKHSPSSSDVPHRDSDDLPSLLLQSQSNVRP